MTLVHFHNHTPYMEIFLTDLLLGFGFDTMPLKVIKPLKTILRWYWIRFFWISSIIIITRAALDDRWTPKYWYSSAFTSAKVKERPNCLYGESVDVCHRAFHLIWMSHDLIVQILEYLRVVNSIVMCINKGLMPPKKIWFTISSGGDGIIQKRSFTKSVVHWIPCSKEYVWVLLWYHLH